jgi:hypothetical protein
MGGVGVEKGEDVVFVFCRSGEVVAFGVHGPSRLHSRELTIRSKHEMGLGKTDITSRMGLTPGQSWLEYRSPKRMRLWALIRSLSTIWLNRLAGNA